ncbi:hypothetical protein DICVIV_02380 [Dictyocaulus viviparus]|uniref:Uncharacterized protein n=1 Tax=Dictyocaulus viviparus TaxID=29172 RepID=A0A0D8Y3L9_DICVI|nr:hypothetical protein DICVIV_02380 [Dictyocaulus viviparus]
MKTVNLVIRDVVMLVLVGLVHRCGSAVTDFSVEFERSQCKFADSSQVFRHIFILETGNDNRIYAGAMGKCQPFTNCQILNTNFNHQLEKHNPQRTYQLVVVAHPETTSNTKVPYVISAAYPFPLEANEISYYSKSGKEQAFLTIPLRVESVTIKYAGKEIAKYPIAGDCDDPYSWIPGPGVYWLRNNTWKSIYYYPTILPQILS